MTNTSHSSAYSSPSPRGFVSHAQSSVTPEVLKQAAEQAKILRDELHAMRVK